MTTENIKNIESTILIVDDNPKDLEILGKLLQSDKYQVEFAINGESALDWLNAKPFDLILLDINMPRINGFEVCKRIRSNLRFNSVPIIFLSVEADRESTLKGFELGAQDFVIKPIDSRELLTKVNTYITLKKNIKELDDLKKLLDGKNFVE